MNEYTGKPGSHTIAAVAKNGVCYLLDSHDARGGKCAEAVFTISMRDAAGDVRWMEVHRVANLNDIAETVDRFFAFTEGDAADMTDDAMPVVLTGQGTRPIHVGIYAKKS